LSQPTPCELAKSEKKDFEADRPFQVAGTSEREEKGKSEAVRSRCAGPDQNLVHPSAGAQATRKGRFRLWHRAQPGLCLPPRPARRPAPKPVSQKQLCWLLGFYTR